MGRRGALILASALAVAGLLSRVAPLFDAGGRLLRQFPTEDGYLMLTIARNLGTGLGMSIAAGTIPTNGTQPLATGLWAAVFALVDGQRTAGVAGVLVLELLIGAAAALALFALGRRVFAGRPDATGPAAVAAAAWFASAQSARHGMNCLETGTYALATIGFAWALLAAAHGAGRRPALARWAGLGALLGLTFWVRVDAVLLCAALGVAHLVGALPVWRARLSTRVAELCAAGASCALVAAPWPLHNLLAFGSVMPVSGQSEGFDVAFGQELVLVPAKLLEYLLVVVQVPGDLETHPAVVAGSCLALAAAGVLGWRGLRHADPAARSIAALATLFGAGLVVFYGLLFGAGHFMSRYLFPVSPFLALLTTAGAARLVQLRPAAGPALALAALAAVVGLNGRLYAQGGHHEHFQVVSWVQEHVPDDVWVAAVQTGTLGFFHDRTINLDGKVNPAAMRARRAGRIPEYVVDSDIQYLVDWIGIAEWPERHPVLGAQFDVIVADPQRNLGVVARHGAPRRGTPHPTQVSSPQASPPGERRIE